ncbi:MAG: hypothetical protein GEU90_09595 [Gemmatimonas sp.]|nr:hypothetical protein [Gemmatimonas sp.]
MEISLRQAARCVDAPEEFSVLRDFFGFLTDDPAAVGTLSVRDQIEANRGKHINLDLILVAPSEIPRSARRWVDHGIDGVRRIFRNVGIGVARVRPHIIPLDEAQGFDVITSKSEAKKLTRKFRGSSDDAMDVFIVPEYNVTSKGKVKAGICSIPGCNKNLYSFNGCVIGIRNLTGSMTDGRIARLMAHELGHGLRLAHRDTDGNLMQAGGSGTDLTVQQGRRMRRDCFVRDGCNF